MTLAALTRHPVGDSEVWLDVGNDQDRWLDNLAINLYGTVTLVGGAFYSAWIFWRKRVLLHRTIGNVLIAVGALLPALGGTFSRFGIPGALYLSELLGALWMFIGFVRATTPMRSAQPQPEAAAQASTSSG